MSKDKMLVLAEVGICTLLSVVIVMIGLIIPAFYLLVMLFAGTPMMYLGMRRGVRVLVVVFLVSILLIGAMVLDVPSALLIGVMNFLPGVVMGYALRKRKTFMGIILSGAAVLLFGMVVQLVIINNLGGGTGFADMVNGVLDQFGEEVKSTLTSLKGTLAFDEKEVQRVLAQTIDATRELIFLYFPAFLIGSSIVMGYLIFMLGIFLLHRMRPVRIVYQPFWAFCAPKSMCYLATILYLIAAFSKDTTVWTAALKNVEVLLHAYLVVCGISFIDYKLKKKIPWGYGRAGIYLAGLFVLYPMIGMLVQVLSFLGMIDGVLGFRLREGRVGDE